MPTNRMKRTRGRQTLDYWKIEDLLTGSCLLSAGYRPSDMTGGCGHWTPEQWQEVRDAMRADWRAHGAAFMAWWRGETEQFSAIYASIGGKVRDPAVTPWALTEFGTPWEDAR